MIKLWKKIRKKQVGCFLLVIAGLFCILLIYLIRNGLISQQGAERFSGDGQRYAQISAFYTQKEEIKKENIDAFRSKFAKSLEEASIKNENENARLWIDSYSGKSKISVSSDKNTADVTMLGVGGDFFFMHPLTMVKGYYFANDEVMKDRILIDKVVAWRLFGSTDVLGMRIKIGEQTCLVAGVFELPKKKVYKNALGKTPMIIVPFSLMNQLESDSASINCYEVILPNPVSGFAKQMVLKNIADIDLSSQDSSKLDLEELNVQILENTKRFSMLRLFQTWKTFGTRSMHKNIIEYPFWENVARAKEDLAVSLLKGAILFLLIPCISSLCWGWKRFKNRRWTIKRLIDMIQEKIEAKKKKKWEEKKHEEETFTN